MTTTTDCPRHRVVMLDFHRPNQGRNGPYCAWCGKSFVQGRPDLGDEEHLAALTLIGSTEKDPAEQERYADKIAAIIERQTSSKGMPP